MMKIYMWIQIKQQCTIKFDCHIEIKFSLILLNCCVVGGGGELLNL